MTKSHQALPLAPTLSLALTLSLTLTLTLARVRALIGRARWSRAFWSASRCPRSRDRQR
jgi:hypothetical protein